MNNTFFDMDWVKKIMDTLKPELSEATLLGFLEVYHDFLDTVNLSDILLEEGLELEQVNQQFVKAFLEQMK